MAWPTQLFTWLGYGQYQVSPSKGATGANVPLLIDGYGRLVTVPNAPGTPPNTEPTTWTSSAGLAVSGAIATSPATLLRIQATAMSSGGYLQIFDTPLPPVTGAAPTTVMVLPAGTTSLDLTHTGRRFATGIAWGSSSTIDTFTPLYGNVWLDAEIA